MYDGDVDRLLNDGFTARPGALVLPGVPYEPEDERVMDGLAEGKVEPEGRVLTDLSAAGEL